MSPNTNITSPASSNLSPSSERHFEVVGRDIRPLAERIGDGEELTGFNAEVRVEVVSLNGNSEAGKISKTVGAVVRDYYDFLSDVKAAATASSAPNATDFAKRADKFARETIFLTEEDAQEAADGFAGHHLDYLREDDERQVLLFVPRDRQDHSQFMVADRILRAAIDRDPSVAARMRIVTNDSMEFTALLQEGDPLKTRLVLPDDWAVTGNNLANDASKLIKEIRRIVGHQSDYERSIEADLFVARDDQLRHGGITYLNDMEKAYGIMPIALKSYLRSPALATSVYEGPVPTGAWARVDYGFQTPLTEMAKFLANERWDREVHVPYMATIVSPYALE